MELCINDIESVNEINEDYVFDIEVENNHNYFLDVGKEILVHNSSKTHSILDNIYLLAKNSPTRKIGTITSYALPHLKLGAIRDFESILESYGEPVDEIHNKSDHFFRVGKSIIDYFGIRDNYSKVHGPRRDWLFINEANNKLTYDDYDQMNQRTHDCTWVDYNPRREFWIHDTVIPNFKHAFIRSTFLDNPYLPESEVKKILMKKDKPGFENWWRIYGEGKLGKNEGVIFSNWDYGDFDQTLPHLYGLDFGFYPDPDALVKVAIDRKRKIIYASECFYESEQSMADLQDNVGKYAKSHELIIADCAEPRLIRELQARFNIRAVSKRETVVSWLRIMQEYKIIITEGSFNLAKELSSYIWDDQKAGIPVDEWNHQIDAVRYAFMHGYIKKKGIKKRN